MIAHASFDQLVHDTYFIVGHFHVVLSIGALIGVKLGYEIYSDGITGLTRNEIFKRIEYYTFVIGITLTFLPFHLIGLEGMPRRYKDYPIMYKMWQKIGTIGAIISLISGLLFIYLIYLQFKNKNRYTIEKLNTFIFNENRYRTLDDVLLKPFYYHLYPNTPLLII